MTIHLEKAYLKEYIQEIGLLTFHYLNFQLPSLFDCLYYPAFYCPADISLPYNI